MDFAFTTEYLVYIFAVTITSLLMIIVGGWIKNRFQRGKILFFTPKTRLRRKLLAFVLFIIAIFLTGFLSERLQTALFDYFKRNIATSISGILIIFLIAWILFHFLVWRDDEKK